MQSALVDLHLFSALTHFAVINHAVDIETKTTLVQLYLLGLAIGVKRSFKTLQSMDLLYKANVR